MAVKKYSQLQKKVLMFYRDYLLFAKTKPEVSHLSTINPLQLTL